MANTYEWYRQLRDRSARRRNPAGRPRTPHSAGRYSLQRTRHTNRFPVRFVKLGDLKTLTQRTKAEIQLVADVAAEAVKYISVSGNTVSFWKDAEHTGAADFTVDFPKEIFLDAARTTFVPNFAFAAATYPGATNPSLDGKPVFVLAVKGTTDPDSGTAYDTVTYSFLNMEDLVDVYTIASGDSSKVLSIANNAITVQNDGLHVDISAKADKVTNATAGNFAKFSALSDIFTCSHSLAISKTGRTKSGAPSFAHGA